MKKRAGIVFVLLAFFCFSVHSHTVTFFTPSMDWSFVTGLSIENGKDFDTNIAAVDFCAECNMNQLLMNAGMKVQPSQFDFSTEAIYWPEFINCLNVGFGTIFHTNYYHDIYCEIDFLAGVYAKYRTPEKFDCMLNLSLMTKQARIFAIEDKVPWLGNNTIAFRTEFNYRPIDKLDIFLMLGSYTQYRYMLFLAPDFKIGAEYAFLPVFSLGGQVEIQYIDMFTLSSNLNSVDFRIYSRIMLK